MSKALLVVDITDDTDLSSECDVTIENGDFRLETKAFLKPMPEEREDESCHQYDCCLMTSIGGLGDERCYRCGEANGYNECLNEILRTEEE